MSMYSEVKKKAKKDKYKAVHNYMDGTSFLFNPIDTLRMVTASSIFGEPAYYRNGIRDGRFRPVLPLEWLIIPNADRYMFKTTGEVMIEIIRTALDYDFEATVNWAVTLRTEYNMRLNPQVIMVEAACHAKRVEWNKAHPGEFRRINAKVMARADEPSSQLTYYLYRNALADRPVSKEKLPVILKRSWAEKLEKASDYQLNKYKNTNCGIIDTVRVCHANSPQIDTLMRNGTIDLPAEKQTWEQLSSAGANWHTILAQTELGHMALLRNLRGIFAEEWSIDETKAVLNKLKAGVKGGKQFPFRYYSAYTAVLKSESDHQQLILDALEECIDLSCENFPVLRGKTICLSDNSGSAWGALTSEYGKVKVAEINNLSSIITAFNSDEGHVGVFGNCLETIPISKKTGILSQMNAITEKGKGVGEDTENGIWLFFTEAIRKKEHWDNIFIYSDMQAGHGGLYGFRENDYLEGDLIEDMAPYIDVLSMLNRYRKEVNPKVNVFSVQTAGYDNAVIPENTYRAALLTGWTGKEALYAQIIIDMWDEIESRKPRRTTPKN